VYEHAFLRLDVGIKEAVRSFYQGILIKDFGFMGETVLYEAKLVADFYRRNLSKDMIEELDPYIFKDIPPSGWDETGYIPINDKELKN